MTITLDIGPVLASALESSLALWAILVGSSCAAYLAGKWIERSRS